MTADWQTWSISPRDPLVFGTGARTSALLPAGAGWLPPQATAAGVVRSTLAGGGTRVSPEEARRLLEVRIRGPWLVEGDGDSAAGGEPWVPIPADSVLGVAGAEEHLVRGTLIAPGADEGVSGRREGGVPPFLCSLPGRWRERKTRFPGMPYRPLSWVIGWSLADDGAQPWEVVDRPTPVQRETRIHLGIDDDHHTAEPEALFGTAGVRFADGFHLAIEIGGAVPEVGVQPPAAQELVMVGGEARVSALAVRKGAALPPYDRYRREIEQRIADLAGRLPASSLGLRLQLLSAGSFGGWRPEPWPAALGALDLAAVAISGFEPVSGWNLQGGRSGRGAPRRVRRLVPAGSVYVFGPIDSVERLAELCESLWGTSLCDHLPGDPERFLAPPSHDGYGTLLPLPCDLTPSIREI